MINECVLNDKSAVIVCSHIAKEHMPVCIAIKDMPISAEDSGWQFLCGQDIEEDEPVIWALCEILDYDPSLAPIIHLNAPVILQKSPDLQHWIVLEE